MTAADLIECARMKQADVSRVLARLADYGLAVSARPGKREMPGRPPLLWRADEDSPAWALLDLAERAAKFTR